MNWTIALAASCCLVVTAAAPTFAQARDSTPVERRAAQIVAAINGGPFDIDTLFAPTFLAQLPSTRIHQLFAQLATQFGAIDSVTPTASGTSGASGTSVTAGLPKAHAAPTSPRRRITTQVIAAVIAVLIIAAVLWLVLGR